MKNKNNTIKNNNAIDNSESNAIDNSESARSSDVIRAFDIFIPDGANAADYRYFSSSPFRIVPTNCKLLVVGRFDRSKDYMQVKGEGLQSINPVLEKSIFVPTNTTSIDYAPGANDIGGFKFQTDVSNTGINIELDPVVKVRIIDPIKYLYTSNNVLAELKDLVMTVIRGFVAKRTANELLTTTKYSLSDLDENREFENFKNQYGLKVEDLSFKNAKLPDDIINAREQSAVAKESINKAEFERQAALHKAQANSEFFKVALEQARSVGLEGKELNDFVRTYANVEMSRNPNAHIFMNTGGNGNNSSMSEQMLFNMYCKMCGMDGSINNQKVVDGYGEYVEEEPVDDEPKPYQRKRLR